MTKPSTSAAAASLDTEQKYDILKGYLKNRTACISSVDIKYKDANNYYQNFVFNMKSDGRFNKKYSSDFKSIFKGEDECKINYLNKLDGLTDSFYVDISRADIARQAQYFEELADGLLSFVRFRMLMQTSVEKTRSDYAAAKASQEATARQQAAARAAEETQQAEADAEEQDRTNAQTAAMLGMMGGMMNQPTYARPSRTPSYTPSYASPNIPSSNTIRYANQCISLGRRTDSGDGISVTNSCSAKVTVWTRDSHGLDFLTVGPGTHNWTTLVARLDYACFVQTGQQLCER